LGALFFRCYGAEKKNPPLVRLWKMRGVRHVVALVENEVRGVRRVALQRDAMSSGPQPPRWCVWRSAIGMCYFAPFSFQVECTACCSAATNGRCVSTCFIMQVCIVSLCESVSSRRRVPAKEGRAQTQLFHSVV
jgi:hypothetical protein